MHVSETKLLRLRFRIETWHVHRCLIHDSWTSQIHSLSLALCAVGGSWTQKTLSPPGHCARRAVSSCTLISSTCSTCTATCSTSSTCSSPATPRCVHTPYVNTHTDRTTDRTKDTNRRDTSIWLYYWVLIMRLRLWLWLWLWCVVLCRTPLCLLCDETSWRVWTRLCTRRSTRWSMWRPRCEGKRAMGRDRREVKRGEGLSAHWLADCYVVLLFYFCCCFCFYVFCSILW